MHQLSTIGTENDCAFAAFFRGETLLVGDRHYTAEKWKDIAVWTLPGGRCEAGETLEAALRREVAEEVGLTDMRILAHLGTVPGVKEGDIVHLFAAATEQDPRNLEPEKFSEWAWKDLESVHSRFINPHVYAALEAYQRQPRVGTVA